MSYLISLLMTMEKNDEIIVFFDETTYLILVQRYKEIPGGDPVGPGGDDVPYDLVGYITEIDTGRIDSRLYETVDLKNI